MAVNKKMKILTRIFYDILLKINKSKSESFETNIDTLKTYFDQTNVSSLVLIDILRDYFNAFYNFCFELKSDNVLKGQINFKQLNNNGST